MPSNALAFYLRRFLGVSVSNGKGVLTFNTQLLTSLRAIKDASQYKFKRDSVATVLDHENCLRTVKNNEPRFQKARRVANLIVDSTYFAHADWAQIDSIERGILAPDGSNTAVRLSESTQNDNFFFVNVLDTIGVGSRHTGSVWLRTDSPTGATLGLFRNDGATYEGSTAVITIDTTWKRFSVSHLFEFAHVASRLVLTKLLSNGLESIDVWHPQVENTTSAKNSAPSEYIPTGNPSTNIRSLISDFTHVGATKTVGTSNIPVDWHTFIGTASDNWQTADGVLTLSRTGSTNVWLMFVQDFLRNRGLEDATVSYTYEIISASGAGLSDFKLQACTAISPNGITAGGSVQLPTTVGIHTVVVKCINADEFALITSGASGNIDIEMRNIDISRAEYGSNVDGVQCFDTENWNSVDATTNVVTERYDEAPKLRQRLVENKFPAEMLDFTLWTRGTDVIHNGDGRFTRIALTDTGVFRTNVSMVDFPPTPFDGAVVCSFEIRHISGIDHITVQGTGSAVGTNDVFTGSVGSEWQRLYITEHTFTAGTTWLLQFVISNASSSYQVRNIQMELRNDNTDLIPSEFVSIGVPTTVTQDNEINGDSEFDNDAHWLGQGTTWTIENGIATCLGNATLYANNQTEAGKLYHFELSCPRHDGGSLVVYVGGTVAVTVTSAGIYSGSVVATNTQIAFGAGGAADFEIDYLRVTETHHGYFDAGVTDTYLDGIKGFDTENGNTVLNNIVTYGTGDPIKPVDGYLSEGRRQSLLAYSKDLSIAQWTKTNVSSTFHSYIKGIPFYRIEALSTQTAFFRINTALDTAVADRYIHASMYAKAAEVEQIMLFIHDGANVARCRATLTGDGIAEVPINNNGFLGVAGVRLVDAEEGIYYVWCTGRQSAAPTAFNIYIEMGAGGSSNSQTAGDGVLVSSPMVVEHLLEVGYIETNGAFVSTDLDELSYTDENFSDTEGTAHFDLLPNSDGTEYPSFYPVISLRNTVTSLAYVHTGVQGVASYDGSGAAVTVGTEDLFKAQPYNVAISWGANNHRMSLNGSAAGTDVFDGSFDGNVGEIRVGWYNTANQQQGFCGVITDIQMYKIQVDDTKLLEYSS